MAKAELKSPSVSWCVATSRLLPNYIKGAAATFCILKWLHYKMPAPTTTHPEQNFANFPAKISFCPEFCRLHDSGRISRKCRKFSQKYFSAPNFAGYTIRAKFHGNLKNFRKNIFLHGFLRASSSGQNFPKIINFISEKCLLPRFTSALRLFRG